MEEVIRMRDATDQPSADRLTADGIAELAPRLYWQSPTPLAQALAAPLGPKSETVAAYVNEGRWVVACPDCGSAQLTAASDPRFMCHECANIAVSGTWRRVRWPKDVEGIDDALNERQRVNQHWLPGETADDLRAETAARNAVASIDETPNWEGHTHTWPTKLPKSKAELVTCDECGLAIPSHLVAEDRKAQG